MLAAHPSWTTAARPFCRPPHAAFLPRLPLILNFTIHFSSTRGLGVFLCYWFIAFLGVRTSFKIFIHQPVVSVRVLPTDLSSEMIQAWHWWCSVEIWNQFILDIKKPSFSCYKLSEFTAEVVAALYLVPCCWHWGHVQCRTGYGEVLPSILQIWEKSLETVLVFTLTPAAQHEQCAK